MGDGYMSVSGFVVDKSGKFISNAHIIMGEGALFSGGNQYIYTRSFEEMADEGFKEGEFTSEIMTQRTKGNFSIYVYAEGYKVYAEELPYGHYDDKIIVLEKSVK